MSFDSMEMPGKIQGKHRDGIRTKTTKKWKKIVKQNMAWSKKFKIKMASSSLI